MKRYGGGWAKREESATGIFGACSKKLRLNFSYLAVRLKAFRNPYPFYRVTGLQAHNMNDFLRNRRGQGYTVGLALAFEAADVFGLVMMYYKII